MWGVIHPFQSIELFSPFSLVHNTSTGLPPHHGVAQLPSLLPVHVQLADHALDAQGKRAGGKGDKQ